MSLRLTNTTLSGSSTLTWQPANAASIWNALYTRIVGVYRCEVNRAAKGRYQRIKHRRTWNVCPCRTWVRWAYTHRCVRSAEGRRPPLDATEKKLADAQMRERKWIKLLEQIADDEGCNPHRRSESSVSMSAKLRGKPSGLNEKTSQTAPLIKCKDFSPFRSTSRLFLANKHQYRFSHKDSVLWKVVAEEWCGLLIDYVVCYQGAKQLIQ